MSRITRLAVETPEGVTGQVWVSVLPDGRMIAADWQLARRVGLEVVELSDAEGRRVAERIVAEAAQ